MLIFYCFINLHIFNQNEINTWTSLPKPFVVKLNDFLHVLDIITLVILLLLFLVLLGIRYRRLREKSRGIQNRYLIRVIVNKIIYIFYILIVFYFLTIIFQIWKITYTQIDFNIPFFNFYLQENWYTKFFKCLILFTSANILQMSKQYIKTSPRTTIEFPIIFLLMIIFLELLICSFELVTMLGCIIGFSFCLYMLIFSDYTNYLAREASVKYFYLSALSTAILGFGILCTYDIFGVTQFIYIKLKINSFIAAGYLSLYPFYFKISIAFIIIGFLFKLSAFPCHLWAPEVYEGSSDPVTAIFMLPIKVSVLGIFIRLLSYTYGTNLNVISFWQPLLIVSAVGSMIWGCLAAVQERKIKRFVAYTSINQMGFLLMGVACATHAAYVITLFYLLIYIVMLIGFLYIYLSITVVRIPVRNQKILFGSLVFLSDFNAFGKYYRAYSLILILIVFSMAGIPPLAGFLGKFYLFVEVFRCNLRVLLILSLITSFISTYYYLRIISILFFDFYQDKKQNSRIQQHYIFLYTSSLDTDEKGLIKTIFCTNYLLLIWVFNNIVLDSLILVWSNMTILYHP